MPKERSRDTKAAILDEAMRLFSEQGFRATTVRDIASAVGIKDASLYNHYPSKQAMFDAIVEQALDTMKEGFYRRGALFLTTDDASIYGDILFCDPYVVRLRKLLVINQFENERATYVYRLIFAEQPLRLQETVFSHLMKSGEFEQGDARLFALEFYGPLFLMMHAGTPWSEAQPVLETHLESFYLAHATVKELP